VEGFTCGLVALEDNRFETVHGFFLSLGIVLDSVAKFFSREEPTHDNRTMYIYLWQMALSSPNTAIATLDLPLF
jgi:hypothetical protein